MTHTTTIEIGQSIIIDGEINEIVSIKGRWVRISNGDNISRATAIEGREEYLEDAATLGGELDDAAEEDEQDADDTCSPEAPEGEEEGAEDGSDEDNGYAGPMLRLRERLAEGAYSKAPNGQPCCGDQVATLLGTLAPASVIRACIVAMALPANPYAHLNVGQQSMNLRNKLRGCFKREEFGFGVLVEAVEQIQEEIEAARIAHEADVLATTTE